MEEKNIQQQQEGEAPRLIAYTFIQKQGDERNVLSLTENALHITYKGKHRAFSLAYLQEVALEHRKLWLPLIGGGILSSLCLLALLHTFSIPFRLLGGAAAGLLMMWWGYRGSMALVVYESRHHTDFLLNSAHQPLELFIAFANRLIRRYPQPMGNYCLELSFQEWQELQEQGQLQLEEARICIPEELSWRQPTGSDKYWLCFDPLRMGNRLQWSMRGKELEAYIQGPLRRNEVELMTKA